MLLSIHLALMLIAFVFMVLSFIPLGEKRKSVRVSEGEEIKEESQSFVVIFPWISMALFFVLATTSMDITILNCELTTGDVWSCNETQFYDAPLGWLFGGLGIIMLVYSILATLLWSAGSLIVEVKKLAGNN